MNHGYPDSGLSRRNFLAETGAAAASAVMLAGLVRARAAAPEPQRLAPLGQGKGLHPGRVVWVHNPRATNWKGPGDGHWWEATHTPQQQVDTMVAHGLLELTGDTAAPKAWDQLFRHHNKACGRGETGYRPGEKIMIKVNFVGCIRGGGNVNPDTYDLEKRPDYMNTSPQMILALLRQLIRSAGVPETDLCVGDPLGYFPNELYAPLHAEFPNVRYVDCAGKFGRTQAKPSTVPFHWSCRPQATRPDFAPAVYAEASYLVNLANLKAHTGAGVTLCAKNHYGSLVRSPTERGYYEMHRSAFAKETKAYRTAVDLMGHAHFGGKTFLFLIDGLYPGKHPIDAAPRKWNSAPFNGQWASSLLVSQDPVAIDSVGFDFLWTEWEDFPRQPGADDYLHEAALADNPPSGTFYDPNHSTNVTRLASLGVHEHWNSATEKKYSRNLGKDEGIELVKASVAG
jgi:hypothetical protein